MYIIYGSKKNIYKSIPLKGVKTIESYEYKFFGKTKLRLSIGKVSNLKSKIKVIDYTTENCINLISVKFFGNFKNITDARKEIKSLISFGNLNTEMVQIL